MITGGDSGIGRAVSVHFAREGADVAIVYTDRKEVDARKTKELVEAEGRRCLLLPGDLRKPSFISDIVGRVISEYSHINILVNNAANHVEQREITGITDEQLEVTFELNMLAIFRLTKAVLPHTSAYDCIINTTSVVSYRGSKNLIDYTATKGAIRVSTRALSQQLVNPPN